jgi:hypothetical protein
MQLKKNVRRHDDDEIEDAPETRQDYDLSVLDDAGCCLADLDEALQPEPEPPVLLSPADERRLAYAEYEQVMEVFRTHGAYQESLRVWRAKWGHLHLTRCCGTPL